MEHTDQKKQDHGIARERRSSKWEERSLIDAIRERGYEPDEVVIRSE